MYIYYVCIGMCICYCQDQQRKLDYNNRFILQLTDIQYHDKSDSSGWYTKRQFTFKQTECFPKYKFQIESTI